MRNLFEELMYDFNNSGEGVIAGIDVDNFERNNTNPNADGEGFFNHIAGKAVDLADELGGLYMFKSDDSDNVYDFCVEALDNGLDVKKAIVIITDFEYWEEYAIEAFNLYLDYIDEVGSIVLVKNPIGSPFEKKLQVIF